MNKKNLILGGVLLVLAAGAYVYQGPGKDWMEKKDEVKNILFGIKIEDADKIEVDAAAGKVSFEKKDNRWKISGTKDFYLPQERYEAIANALKEGIVGDFTVVSQNATKKADFNTDDKNGIKVKITQADKVLGEFVIGKISSDYSSVYLSKLGDSNTYSVKAVGMYSAFAADDWRDKTIFSGDKEKLSKIRFQDSKKKSEFIVEKKDGKWSGVKPSNFKIGDGKLDAVLENMANLTAIEIPEQKFDKTGLDKQPFIVQATGEGMDNTIMIGNDNGKGNFYAKKGSSDNIYLITKAQKEDLEKTIAGLR